MEYIGENLWPGRIGNFFLMLGFVLSLTSMIAYALSVRTGDIEDHSGWRKMGRISFSIHGLSVLIVIGSVFYMMINKHYEYQYVQSHVNDDLSLQYVFSAFWEGQEGSFLLWMFWQVVIGGILLFTAKQWESAVMAPIALLQAILNSMLLGVYIGFGDNAFKLGSNPTLLIRETIDLPLFNSADYVSLLEGTGLNPLLQNYWMTIHPPTLFLGFALVSVPFCYTIAGLWRRQHKAWLKPAQPWALFAGGILGIGILMGSAWAYEALTFGGYWAWDPVENASLVPWLLLVAGIHTHLVARSTGRSIRTTYIFYMLALIFTLYSTFLTRSGVLGETSAHSFTEMGLEWQLVILVATFTLLSLVLLISRWKETGDKGKEDAASSKEFWVFIGSLVLLISSILIIGATSLPVLNKIREFFDPTFQGQVITDPNDHYNRYQLFIAVLIGLLSGGTQFLRWREVNWKKRSRYVMLHIGIGLLLSALLTFAMRQWIKLNGVPHIVLLFSALFAIVSNLDYLLTSGPQRVKKLGSVMSHVGFGLMLIGILATTLNKRYLSQNAFIMEGLIEGADEGTSNRNVLLYKGIPMIMDDYTVTYVSDTLDGVTRTFHLDYARRNEQGQVVEQFRLSPNVLYSQDFSRIAASNPATKHYPLRDVFTHIPSLPRAEIGLEEREKVENELNYRKRHLKLQTPTLLVDTIPLLDRDTFLLREFQLEYLGLNSMVRHEGYQPLPGDVAISAQVAIHRQDGDSTYMAYPVVVLRDQLVYSYPYQIDALDSKVKIDESVLEQVIPREDEVNYQEIKLKPNQDTLIDGVRWLLQGFSRDSDHPRYEAVKNDIALTAVVDAILPDGQKSTLRPLYYIREDVPNSLKDFDISTGLHARLTNLDPATETGTFLVAYQAPEQAAIPVSIATNSYRTDWLVLEAIEFSGINFFWLGTIMMMLGLLISTLLRLVGIKVVPDIKKRVD